MALSMIIEKYKILFVHIPRTGGTTIGNILNNDIYKNFLHNKTIKLEHKYYDNYKNIIGDSIREYFVFSFVRNPYSRLFSFWRNCCDANPKTEYIFSCHKKNTELSLYIDQPNSPTIFQKFVECLYNERNQLHLLGNTQYSMIHKNDANFIGKYENFNIDLKRVINLLNYHVRNKVFFNQSLHANKLSKNIHEYKSYYNSNTQKLVNTIYANDFVEFNYPTSI